MPREGQGGRPLSNYLQNRTRENFKPGEILRGGGGHDVNSGKFLCHNKYQYFYTSEYKKSDVVIGRI